MVVVECSVYGSMSSYLYLFKRISAVRPVKNIFNPKNRKLSFLHKDDLSRPTPPPELKVK